jgi:cyclopropane fatty-acyl-phospholipid synthase-like methyltransferase
MQTVNINDTFFNGVYKEVWRRLIQPGLSEAECDFLIDVAHLQPGDAVLDLMCGYGRHALELAKRGYAVTAVDNSTDYIAEIETTAQENAWPVNAIASGALEVNLTGTYKAAICMGNSFAFFNREDALALLKKVAAHLEDNGVFVINSWMIAEIAIRHFREKDWNEVPGFKCLISNRYCFQPSRVESEHIIIDDNGSMESIHAVDYIFTLSEMEGMFQEAGLKTKGLFSTPKKRPFRLGDNSVYIVAGKQ